MHLAANRIVYIKKRLKKLKLLSTNYKINRLINKNLENKKNTTINTRVNNEQECGITFWFRGR